MSQSSSHTLPCKHTFHYECLVTYFQANQNLVHPVTHEYLHARCPVCRAIIRNRDLPGYSHWLEKFLTIPSERIRVKGGTLVWKGWAGEKVAVQRQERVRVLDALTARRIELLQFSNITGILNSEALERNSEQKPPSQERGSPPTSSPQPDSPVLQAQVRQRHTISTSQPVTSRETEELRILQEIRGLDLPHVQMQIGIVASQIQDLDYGETSQMQDQAEVSNSQESVVIVEERGPPSVQLIEAPMHSQGSVVILEDPVILEPEPVQILGVAGGRGRHTNYTIEWSDGSTTITAASVIKTIDPSLLDDWQVRNRRENTRNCRERRNPRLNRFGL